MSSNLGSRTFVYVFKQNQNECFFKDSLIYPKSKKNFIIFIEKIGVLPKSLRSLILFIFQKTLIQ
jgi:hypothetical protein